MEWDILRADDYAKHICEAYGLNYKQVGRIVIDCQPHELVKIYVTLWGDKRLLEVKPPDPKAVEIVMERRGGESDSVGMDQGHCRSIL